MNKTQIAKQTQKMWEAHATPDHNGYKDVMCRAAFEEACEQLAHLVKNATLIAVSKKRALG